MNLLKPITPHANLFPAFPVFKDSSSPPKPKSSSLSCTITDLPIILYLLLTSRLILLLYIVPLLTLFFDSLFPKSPTCLWSLSFDPWVLWSGLKCEQAVLQPSVKSPYSWIWNPCLPGDKPYIFILICNTLLAYTLVRYL